MKIEIRLFGQVKDFFETSGFDIQMGKEEIVVDDIKKILIQKSLEPEKSETLLKESALATEARILQSDETIQAGGVIFVLPPVCGG